MEQKVSAVKPMHREISESEKLKHQVNFCFTFTGEASMFDGKAVYLWRWYRRG